MHTQSLTYRLAATFFALLLLCAPLAKTVGHAHILEVHQAVETTISASSTTDDEDSSKQPVIQATTEIQAVIISGLHLDFDLISVLSDTYEPFISIKETVTHIFTPSLSGYFQNILRYCITPHAP